MLSNYKPILLANRTKELGHFQQMVLGKIPTRIFLLEAPSGYGKTDLLLKFGESCPSNVCAIEVNLKSADAGIPYIFWRIKDTLGHEHFLNFEAETRDLLREHPNFAKIKREKNSR